VTEALRMGVAHRVQQLRKAAALTQKELGERAGLSRGYVARVESMGENLSLDQLGRLARALEVEPAELLRGIPADPL
jgi:transcriptional regulator with XRE-family HTH domain